MKPLLIFPAALAIMASGAWAQATQTSVLGNSGNPAYPVQVQADNGVVYHCKSNIETIDGSPARRCVRPDDDGGTVFGSGTAGGISNAPVIAAGLLLVIAAASGSSSTTTTTMTN